jgi:hypothetical protein
MRRAECSGISEKERAARCIAMYGAPTGPGGRAVLASKIVF